MNHACIITLVCAPLLLMAAVEDTDQTPRYSEHIVKLGNLEVEWEGDLRLEPIDTHSINVDTEQWNQQAEVLDVIVRDGVVRRGDVLLRLDTTGIDEAILEAQTALDELKTRTDISRQTRAIEAESMATSLEQSVKAEERARRDLKLFEQYRAKIQKERQTMSFERSRNYVDDQTQELQQLESMYGDTTLDDRTKDIVLERARRGLDLAERSFEHTKVENSLFDDYTFPDREQDVKDSARWKQQSLDHLKIRNQLTRMRWQLDIARETRDLEDKQERLDELKADRERFIIKAPIDGILTRIGVEAGDEIGMHQQLAQVHDPATAQLEGTIEAADLLVLEQGMKVSVEAPAFPGLTVPGSIRSIGLVGSPSGAGTSFPIEITLSKQDDRLRLGLACRAIAKKTLKRVLRVPAAAVGVEDGDRHFVRLMRGENIIEQEVVTGQRNDGFIEIISGLKAGDRIQVPMEEYDG